MQISPRELRDLASSVDDMHRDGMRTLRDELEEVHRGDTARVLTRSRRQFLTRAGTGGVALAAATTVTPFASFLPTAWARPAQALDDGAIAVFAESVELAAVAAYGAAAGTGLIAAEVLPVAQMFAGHHQEHAGAFAGLAGDAATGAPNQALLDEFGPLIGAAPDQAALLEIAFTLEQAAAATYLFALGALQSPEAAAATATILPVESQHAVVLGQALGKPTSDFIPSFETQSGALDPAMYPVG